MFYGVPVCARCLSGKVSSPTAAQGVLYQLSHCFATNNRRMAETYRIASHYYLSLVRLVYSNN